ncbi:hypothetical protein [Emcibacter sp.]|uniref:hypothetical protein n=1 Tax=Emcibacter sp. TaxID=1979954 RepID=UPI002AA7FB76|nr:hypothetical protein [Emcibacter sp.]
MAKNKEVWIRTDETNEFLGDLKHLSHLLKLVLDNPATWKWVILTLHNTLEGALICHIGGHDTSGTLYLTPASAKAVLERLNDRDRQLQNMPWPKEKLLPMNELYKLAKKEKYLTEAHAIEPNTSMDFSIKILHEHRNLLDHFRPQGLSMDICGLPQILSDFCEIIKQFTYRKATTCSRLPDHKEIIQLNLDAIQSDVKRIAAHWAS